MKGKQVSLWSKIGAAVFVVAAFSLSAIFKWDLDVWDVIQVGLFLFVLGAPIDVSLIIETFRKPNA
jgi:hypothetical protein